MNIMSFFLFAQDPPKSFRPSTNTTANERNPPVLTTESVHININNSPLSPTQPAPATISAQKVSGPAIIDVPTTKNATTTPNNSSMQGMRTIELSTGRVREGFGEWCFICSLANGVNSEIFANNLLKFASAANGDVIVTLLPINTKWPWITPAVFRPELVPEELMAQGLTV